MRGSVLVSGGAGYIGSVVVGQLLARGHTVVVLDDLSRGHRKAVAPDATFVQGGIGDRGVLDALLRRHPCDALVHLDRKSTRLNSSHSQISYAVFCLKKKKITNIKMRQFASYS